jgi:hypothetical protein
MAAIKFLLESIPEVSKYYPLSYFIWDNIIRAPKKIKPEILKILFGRLKNLFGLLIKLFGPIVRLLNLKCVELKIFFFCFHLSNLNT